VCKSIRVLSFLRLIVKHRQSSNSAIFERDIEPSSANLISTVESINGHAHPPPPGDTDPKSSAVLDSAIAALTEDSNQQINDPTTMNIAVISPTATTVHASGTFTPTGMSSPGGLRSLGTNPSRGTSISKTRNFSMHSGPNSVVGGSRSPSPTRRSFSVNVPGGQASPGSQSPRIPSMQSNTLVSGTFGTSSPTATSSVNVSPSMSPLSNIMPLSAQEGFAGPIAEAQSHSPSYSQGGLSPLLSQASKRLSFVSYSDILNSAPLSSVPFSTIITSDEPPPHLPAVMGSTMENVPASGSSVVGSDAGEWLGGEWEREGFGKGLEERLEAVLNKERDGQPASPSEGTADPLVATAH